LEGNKTKEDSKLSFEIHSNENEKVSLVVKFSDSSEVMTALDELERIQDTIQMRQSILRIREICDTDDRVIYYPKKDVELPKARWLSVAAAASFSKGIPIETILEKSELDRKTIAAYCTSVNNPTSKYLSIKDDSVMISPEGISWVFSLLYPKEKKGT
jgi:hypothetical protein